MKQRRAPDRVTETTTSLRGRVAGLVGLAGAGRAGRLEAEWDCWGWWGQGVRRWAWRGWLAAGRPPGAGRWRRAGGGVRAAGRRCTSGRGPMRRPASKMPSLVSADEAISAAPDSAAATRWPRPARRPPDSTAPASPAAVSTSAASISCPDRPRWYGSAVSPSRRSSRLFAIELGGRAEHREPDRLAGLVRGRGDHAEAARRRGGRPGEQVRHLPVRVMPGGHGRVADQRGGVGGRHRADHGRGGRWRPRRSAAARPVTALAAATAAAPAERGQQPGAHAHRRGHLDHPEHVQEALRPPRSCDQRGGGQADRADRTHLRRPGQLTAAGRWANAASTDEAPARPPKNR